MVQDTRQGWAIFAVMGVLFLGGARRDLLGRERRQSRHSPRHHVNAAPSALQAGGNMEGKEVRFGIANSAIWAVATTDASNGSVNSMHDSYTPLGGLIAMLNIQLGEIIFGGVGSGLYGMLLFAIVADVRGGSDGGADAGISRQEARGRGSQDGDARHPDPAALDPGLYGTRRACFPPGLSSLNNAGPHGFSEILYAFSSGTGNNGSAFAGLNANTPFYNTTLGFAMLLGRFAFIVPMMAVAGSLAERRSCRASAGTFPTHTPLFVGLLTGVILIVGGLTFFPALALGPIAEHFAMHAGNLTEVTTMDSSAPWNRQSPQADAGRDADRSEHPGSGHRRGVSQARPAHDGAQSGHVRGRDRRHAHDDPVHPRHRCRQRPTSAFPFQINLWLWFTVLFANFAEAVAEGRGKAQAATLRKTKTEAESQELSDQEMRV